MPGNGNCHVAVADLGTGNVVCIVEIGRGDQHSVAKIAVVGVDKIDQDRRVDDGILDNGRISAVAAVGIPLGVVAITAGTARGGGSASVADLRNDDVVVAGNRDGCAVLGLQDQRHVAGSVAIISTGHDRDGALDVVLDDRGVAAIAAIGDLGLT